MGGAVSLCVTVHIVHGRYGKVAFAHNIHLSWVCVLSHHSGPVSDARRNRYIRGCDIV